MPTTSPSPVSPTARKRSRFRWSRRTPCLRHGQRRRLRDDPERRPVVRHLLRRPVPAHQLRDPLPGIHRAGHDARFANNRAYADLGRLYANAGVVDTSVEEAAFQIAVWEIAYETTPGAYALGSGAASFSGGSAAGGALGLAATWLTGLGNGAGRSISVIESADHQDVIFAPVPEPSTYMLMVAGLLATVEVSRRKRKQA